MIARRVLLFYPPNRRSIAIETLCRVVSESGNELILLTLTEKGALHEALEKYGMKTFAYPPKWKRLWKYARFYRQSGYLARFCRENNIDTIWSHLQEANIIAVMAQPFLKARLILFRHHSESSFFAEFGKKMNMKRSKGEVLLDKIINRFGKEIVVPSSGVWEGMEKYEKCDMKKVKLIPYIYDFSSYHSPDDEKVKLLRQQYPCRLLLIMISRMVPSKQHMPVLEVMNKLIKEGMSVKMIMMDDGVLRGDIEKFIADNDLSDHFVLTGYRQDFVNYMMAADLLMHPSVTEASNNVAKEMALLEKAVAVCRNVGDFSDYIEENRNGYFLESDALVSGIEAVTRDAYDHPDKLKRLGAALKIDVLERFSDTPQNRQHYLDLLN